MLLFASLICHLPEYWFMLYRDLLVCVVMVGRELQLFYPVSPLSHVPTSHPFLWDTSMSPCRICAPPLSLATCIDTTCHKVPNISNTSQNFARKWIPYSHNCFIINNINDDYNKFVFFLTDQVTNGISQRKRINSLLTIELNQHHHQQISWP